MTTLDIAGAEKALREERAHLVHQLDELGAAETGDLRADIDFGGSFADAAAGKEMRVRASFSSVSTMT